METILIDRPKRSRLNRYRGSRRNTNNTPAIAKTNPIGFMINYNAESGVMDIILSDKVFSYRVDQNKF
ncbi:hypothetical protein JGH11_16015 [Dysgonomonas sp. Marseille-P4677]|uniref:hypothetical protein n=1 Tax=Dysgonomonas sp. Marseille-P4677 TaxID=2364790 RepID=UPI001912ED49|nr:hypothetical protein [Dysgonomonas sp. Marseille-P4677]MBK5722382.1 hypothetical protein [Dysgonomonas sp. Marseille-P4677]